MAGGRIEKQVFIMEMLRVLAIVHGIVALDIVDVLHYLI